MPSDATVSLLFGSAATLAAFHTLIGVDHSLPFIALGQARGWTLGRTLWVTAACGLVHVASSVLIGTVGIGLGIAIDRLASLESTRGRLAAWVMVGFGLAYAAWALWRRRAGLVSHFHCNGGASPAGGGADAGGRTTTWALFLVFAFGPCEALIPLMMVPAALRSWAVMLGVVAVFAVCTVGAMLCAVALGVLGLRRAHVLGLERHADLLAGLAVAASGAGVLLLGF